MVKKKVRSFDGGHLDVFEAVKRAFIRRGFIPTRHRPKDTGAKLATIVSEDPSPNAVEEDGPAESSEQLVDLTANAHEVLMEVSTIFPFTLFPDTITIDREKLTIANRFFFKVASINSIPISDIQSVEANVGPFFGSIGLVRATLTTLRSSFAVRFLWRDDAIKIQRLLQGYIIAHQKEVDCSAIEKEQLITLLNDLGQGVSN